MSVLKRISTTLFSRVDQLVGEIENHDALIQAAITEQRKKIAAAKVQLGRIQAQQNRIQQQTSQLQQSEQRWEQRAIKEATQDEAKALMCIQRRQHIKQQISKSQQAEQEYHRAAERMIVDINRSEDELKNMSQKHELMRARQSSAEALNIVNQTSAIRSDELENSFDRWEIKITENEISSEHYDDTDLLEQAYIKEENKDILREELHALINKESDNAND